MRAGRLDRRIELQTRAVPTGGDPMAGTWTTQATVWAERLDAKGAERFAGQFIAEAQGGYVVRYRTDVTPTWRLKDGTELWNVVAANEGRGRRVETVILVKRFDPNDDT